MRVLFSSAYFMNILNFSEYYSPDVWMAKQKSAALYIRFFSRQKFFYIRAFYGGEPHLKRFESPRKTPVHCGRFSRDCFILYVSITSHIFFLPVCHCLCQNRSLPSANNGQYGKRYECFFYEFSICCIWYSYVASTQNRVHPSCSNLTVCNIQ